MTPVTFDGCLGWLHEAASEEGGATRGVVMCSALGFEELCARQSWRVLADRLAEAGLPTLRFDYHGTGDSTGQLGDDDRLDTWLGNIAAAARWLEANAQITELVLVGINFGATLAAAAAQAHGKVAKLVLLAPAVSGRAYGRELQLAAQVMVTEGGQVATAEPGDGDIEVAGFATTRRQLADLKRLDLMQLERSPARSVLLVRNRARAGQEAIAEHFTGLGANVTTREFADYHRMMIDPTNSRPFLGTINVVVDWLGSDARIGRDGALSCAPPPTRSSAYRCRAKPATGLPHAVIAARDWRETPVQFGPGQRLVGILCEPTRPAPGRPCSVLVGSGRDSHVGWARGSVELSRRLAGNGIAALRFDLERIGDSQPDTSGKRIGLHALSSLEDVTAALDLMEARNYQDITLFGGCSGAYLAFRTALADPRVKTMVLRNPQRFVWRLADAVLFEMDEYASAAHGAVVAEAVNGVEAKRPAADGPAASGDVVANSLVADKKSLKFKLAKAGFHAARMGVIGASWIVSRLSLHGARLQWTVARFTARGGRMLMIYSANDMGLKHLAEIFGDGGERITALEGVDLEFFEGADHNFTSAEPRLRLAAAMCDFVLGPSEKPATQAQSIRSATE